MYHVPGSSEALIQNRLSVAHAKLTDGIGPTVLHVGPWTVLDAVVMMDNNGVALSCNAGKSLFNVSGDALQQSPESKTHPP
mgnify:CR=1 FL=1